jgi:hypothetical protein
VLVVHGCSPDAAATPDVVRRDSAGVQIVESSESQARAAVAWTLDSVPAVDIGTVEGDERYQLFRVTGATQLRDGRIVIVNAGTQQIRFFDQQGTFLHSVGGRGEGPGEYAFPLLVPAVTHDTLWIADFNQRLTLLDMQGTLLETFVGRARISQPVGVLGASVVTRTGSASAGPNSTEAIVPNDVALMLADPATGAQDTIARLDGFDLLLWRQGQQFGFTRVPFDVEPSAAVAADRIYIAPGERSEVQVIDSAGALRAIYRIMLPSQPVAQSEFDEVVARAVARAPDEAAAVELRRRYGTMEVPAVRPFFQNLLLDAGGNVWLEEFRADPQATPYWIVLDADGAVLGRLATPRGVTILQIGDDFVLGTMRDESDVEHVVRYSLRRS